jgi:TfoX/Sxy family transcriptional regulator of competence genes
MALNPELTKRVRQVLGHLDHIEEKKMFRGIAFMVNGKMCVTVGDNHIMCRIDPSTHQEVILHKGVSTVKMKGRDYIGWINVDESVVPDKKTLTYWVKLALEYNEKIR